MDFETDSKQLDKEIKKYFWWRVTRFLAVSAYFIGAVIITIFNNSENKTGGLIIWMGVMIILFVCMYSLRRKVSSRKLISYSLYKISNDLQEGKVDKKNLIFLKRCLNYSKEEKERIIKADFILESERLKEVLLKKSISELIEKINYASEKNQLNQINKEYIENIARDIYYRNPGIVELSLKTNKELKLEQEKILSGISIVRGKLFRTRMGKFIFSEFILGVLSFLTYFFLTKNIETILIFVATISSAIIVVTFGNKKAE